MSYIYEVDKKSGRVKINDSEKFIKILAFGSEEDVSVEMEEHYDIMKNYSKKQIGKIASDIPYSEYDYIINMAIGKAIKDFDPTQNTNILSFLWEKLRGEITSYKTKKQSLQNKVFKTLENNKDEYIYQKDKKTNENTLEHVDMESLDKKLEREDFHRRQIKAFKMALSGIPRRLQFILEKVSEGKKTREIAEMLGLEEFIVSRDRNKGLSLILQRIMRSNHLMEDEKKKIADFHGLEFEMIDIDDIPYPI